MARATISLPLPEGPVISTEALVGATCEISRRTTRIAALSPISSDRTLLPSIGSGRHASVMRDAPREDRLARSLKSVASSTSTPVLFYIS